MTTGITLGSGITVGSGITIGSGHSITLSAGQFSAGYFYQNGTVQYPEPLGTNGTAGWTLDLSHIPPDSSYWKYIGYVPWQGIISDSAVGTFFQNLVTQGILNNPYEDALWNVTWGPGSSITSGVVSMSGGANVGDSMYITTVDTGQAGWNTVPPYNGATYALAGTFYFPATFTLIQPVVNKGGFC